MADYTIFLNAIEADLAISGAYYDLVANGGRMVHKYGDETISGVKDFADRPTVGGVGVLLVGEGGGGSYGDVVSGVSGIFGGNNTINAGINQVVWSSGSTVSANYAMALGGTNNNVSGNQCSIINGQTNYCSGTRNTIINGIANRLEGGSTSCIIAGQGTRLSGQYSVAFGNLHYVSGNNNLVTSSSNKISGDNNIILGIASYITGYQNIAIGNYVRIPDDNSIVISTQGDPVYSSGDFSIVLSTRSGIFLDSSLIYCGTAPATSTDNCYKGQIAVDDSYIYVGTGVNQWGRAALSNF